MNNTEAAAERVKALASLQAFLPDDREIVKILKYCQLEPQDGSWRRWENGHPRGIKIAKNKAISIYRKDTDLSKIEDLYFYVNHIRSIELAKVSLIVFQTPVSASILSIGTDSIMRVLRNEHDVWFHNSPLTLPLKDSRDLIQNENIFDFKRLNKPNKEVGRWVTTWPPSKALVQDIEKEITCNSPIKSLIAELSVM